MFAFSFLFLFNVQLADLLSKYRGKDIMAVVMDLDLKCSSLSPEPSAPQDHRLTCATLRQEHTFRHQVKDMHRLYWALKNLPSTSLKLDQQSGDVLHAGHSLDGFSHTVILPVIYFSET